MEHDNPIQDSKNTVSNSSINAGGNIHIGDIINIQQTVSESSKQKTPFNADQAGAIRKLIGNNKIKQALEQLLQHTNGQDEDLYTQVVQLSQQWNKLQRQETMGIISSSEANVTSNKIVYGLLDVVNQLEQN